MAAREELGGTRPEHGRRGQSRHGVAPEEDETEGRVAPHRDAFDPGEVPVVAMDRGRVAGQWRSWT